MIKLIDNSKGKELRVMWAHHINYDYPKPRKFKLDRGPVVKGPSKTVCMITLGGRDNVIGIGEAVQSKHDLQFNRKVGGKLSFQRAIENARKTGELTDKSTRQKMWVEYFEMRGGKVE